MSAGGGGGGAGGGDDLYPVAIIADELKHEDLVVRLNSMRRIDTIAKALGVERTRMELIPFLQDSIDDDDELLLVMAQELAKFVPFVGGAGHAHVLLPLLESLAVVEEVTVRDMAVKTLSGVLPQLPPKHVSEHYTPLVMRLAGRDWFTARIASCGLFADLYKVVGDGEKAELRAALATLCRDATPMVRRAAAANLAEFLGAVDAAVAKAEFLPIATRLASEEDQDSVRLHAVEVCVALAQLLDRDTVKGSVLPLVLKMSDDVSWRVRWAQANKIVDMVDALGDDASAVVDVFVNRLKDSEAEVRTVAAAHVAAISKHFGTRVTLDRLVEPVALLTEDPSDHVRASLASVIMGLATVLGEAATVKHLLPHFLTMLKDPTSDVRLNIISKLESVNEVVGLKLLSESLLPAILELAEDKQWRVRLAIIEFMPLLAKQLGREFFDRELVGMCKGWLDDSVFSVRSAAMKSLQELSVVFGPGWAEELVLPTIVSLANRPDFKSRMTALLTLRVIGASWGAEVLNKEVVDHFVAMAGDKVPNIRFNVAKAFQALMTDFEAAVVAEKIKPCLGRLCEDPDADVAFYSAKALAS